VANRRKFLQGGLAAPLAAGLSPAANAAVKRDYFRELGVTPIINAAGTYTTFTASLMLPEVMAAIQYASKQYCRLPELHDAVGKRIAELTGNEAAMVTAGAASALTLGTAGCLTGKNPDFVRRIPDLRGMKTEVLIQRAHRFGYDHAVRNTGVRMVEFETKEEFEKLAGPQTAMMLFFNDANGRGQIRDAEFAEMGKKKGIPTFNDCAADVPPVENFSKYTKMGFSIVAFSGGKGIRGPQSAGLLLGRADLIEAARLNGPPNGDTIGRGMKVNKEELLGMLAAVETFVRKDHAAEWKMWEGRIGAIANAVKSVESVKTEQYVPEIANHVPHLKITWDAKKVGMTYEEAAKKMREGTPSIELVPGAKESLNVGVWMLEAGQEKIVARRLKEVLTGKG
jgi:D-glucosaminate-6-phosphate ammonia-lyase